MTSQLPEPHRAQPALRIGDAEREAAVAALGDHFAAGRLTSDEFDARTSAAYAARIGPDIDVLFADLPAPRPVTTPHPPVARRRAPLPVIPIIALLVLVIVAAAHGAYPPVLPLLALVWLGGRRRRAWR
jgi:hypothetical protein